VARLDVLSADDERDLEALSGELVETAPELVALRATGLVAEDRFVVRFRNAEDAVGAHAAILGFAVVAVTQVAYEVEGWGAGELVVSDGRVVWHELPWPRATGDSLDPSQTPAHPGPGPRPLVSGNQSHKGRDFAAEVVQLLQAYFAGEESPLEDVPVDLEYETPFLSRCAEALRTVPRGEVVTYGELAALAGAPGAARAAGGFCARSRLSIFVPCHRVVSANGLGQYGSYGLGYKRRLLALEGYANAV
jgi:methylated-DNA-[protein]-cysteine S-methyltransferase